MQYTKSECMDVNFNCIDVYAVLERANDRKLHVFATKHEANTYSEHLIHSHDDVSIVGLTPIKIYNVTWNSRITHRNLHHFWLVDGIYGGSSDLKYKL